MTKIIKEMLPPDVRVARDAQDLLIECCVGERIVTVLSSFLFTSTCSKLKIIDAACICKIASLIIQ